MRQSMDVQVPGRDRLPLGILLLVTFALIPAVTWGQLACPDCSTLNSACGVGVCNTTTGTCFAQPANEGAVCDDGNVCTGPDVCTRGLCEGGPPVDGTVCDDGNLCTGDGVCTAGACGGAAPVVDGTSCDDANTCTGTAANPDICVAGLCQGTAVLFGTPCDDGNPCTGTAAVPDTCRGGFCSGPANPAAEGLPCDDGNVCTVTDTCSGGRCSGVIDPAREATACDDGNPLTTPDACCGGVCSQVVPDCGARLVVTNSGQGTVNVIRIFPESTLNPIRDYVLEPTVIYTEPCALPPCTTNPGPTTVVVSPDGNTAYITNKLRDSVGVISLIDYTTATPIPIGISPALPIGAALSPDGLFLYVANNAADSVSVIDTTASSVAETILLDPDPLNPGFDNPLREFRPFGVAVTPDGELVYITNNYRYTISVLRTFVPRLVVHEVRDDAFELKRPQGIAVAPTGDFAYVANSGDHIVEGGVGGASVASFRVPDDNLVARQRVGNEPYSVAFTRDSTFAYVSNSNSNSVTPIQTSPFKALSPIDVRHFPQAPCESPTGIATNEDGRFVFVACSKSNRVSVIEVDRRGVVASVDVGRVPVGLAFTSRPAATTTPTSCGLASPPTCGGACPLGETCQVEPVGGLTCLCVPDTTTTTTVTTTTTTIPPIDCGLASPPTCGGTCPLGETCQVEPVGGLICVCLPDTTTTTSVTTTTSTTLLPDCSLTGPPTCGGACPLGETCQVEPVGGLTCVCLPETTTTTLVTTTTSTTTTTIPLLDCALASPPTCGGACLPGFACQPEPVGGLTCVCVPSLLFVMSDSADPVQSGAPLTYAIQYQNTGSEDATNSVVSAVYDPNVGFISSDPPPDLGMTSQWTLGLVKPGESGQIMVTVGVGSPLPDGTILTSQSMMIADGGMTASDTEETAVSTPVFSMAVSGLPTRVVSGQPVEFTAAYQNVSGQPQPDVTVLGNFDPDFIVEEMVPAPDGGGGDSWAVGALADGQSGSMLVRGFFAKPAGGSTTEMLFEIANGNGSAVDAATTDVGAAEEMRVQHAVLRRGRRRGAGRTPRPDTWRVQTGFAMPDGFNPAGQEVELLIFGPSGVHHAPLVQVPQVGRVGVGRFIFKGSIPGSGSVRLTLQARRSGDWQLLARVRGVDALPPFSPTGDFDVRVRLGALYFLTDPVHLRDAAPGRVRRFP